VAVGEELGEVTGAAVVVGEDNAEGKVLHEDNSRLMSPARLLILEVLQRNQSLDFLKLSLHRQKMP
jgi:hypothetical protein